MTHIALYRKYRPQNFTEVRGQDTVVRYLTQVIESGKVPHAMIFTGSRGIGKTTLARIFAKELGVQPHDVYELDAASYTGIDNIRELRDDALTLPMSSPYKVYILDEVHMLSKPAFNGFLKILEEPPAHVIFILATTELHKILPTVISRCQVITLEKPTISLLTDQIIDITNQEGKTIDASLAGLIAERSQGSFRDALVLLGQVIEHAQSVITESDLATVGVRSLDHLVIAFIQAFAKKDVSELLTIVQSVAQNNDKDISEFLEKLLNVFRGGLLSVYAKDTAELFHQSYSKDQQQMIHVLVEQGIITPDLLRKFLEVHQEVRKSVIPAIPLELAIIEILGNTTNMK
jgi:DNA polymerase-3 subunit gamma/tau